ncbi:kinesin-like protein KIF6 [Myzus persicae]|uniref:kinesin-like protein KIF6 n=1 Tax=Myzus persicae TaxID=13164 RepID=UPI000B933392|nr:kinesin-like protein KIF6 [Myzus persicae]
MTPIQVYCRLKPSVDLIKYQIIPTKNQLIYYNKSKLEKFQFQKVFDDNTTQSSIFEHVAVPILDKYLSGTNGTIFAYGQTGSGKSHTIYGSREDEGIIPRSLKYLFDNKLSIQSTDERNIFSMAYFEIYNETVYNLLKSPKNRKKSNVNFNNLGPDNAVRFTVDKNGDVTFKNLNIIRIKNVSQAFKQLISGNTRRQVSSTFLNHKSSRSHCICRIEYVNWRKGEKSNKTVLNLVDLAGSECISKLNNDKKTIVESKYINLSLMHLHQVDLNGDDEGHSVNCEPQTVVVHNDDSAEGIIADKESGENSCMELVLVNKNCGDQMTKLNDHECPSELKILFIRAPMVHVIGPRLMEAGDGLSDNWKKAVDLIGHNVGHSGHVHNYVTSSETQTVIVNCSNVLTVSKKCDENSGMEIALIDDKNCAKETTNVDLIGHNVGHSGNVDNYVTSSETLQAVDVNRNLSIMTDIQYGLTSSNYQVTKVETTMDDNMITLMGDSRR